MQVLIIGAGEVGFHTALRLSHEGHRVVVVDRLPERVRQVSEQMDVQTLVGPGSSPVALKAAGVDHCDLVLVVTNSDEVNLTACRFARLLAPAATLIARIRSTDYLRFFEEVGAASLDVDTVINPEREVANQIMEFLAVPAASSVTDFAGGKVKMLGLKIPATCSQVGRPLSELRIAGGPRFLVVAIERGGQVIIPGGGDVILSEDLAYVVTRRENTEQVVAHFGMPNQPVKNLVVVGGGAIGRLVAARAREMGIKIRIIEKSPARCEALVDELEDVTVLNGDGTDLSLLEEENVGAADVFAAITDDEEENVLIAMLGRKMGARRTIARVAHLGYVPLVSSLGLDLVVSPRFAAVGAILRHLRAGKVLAVAPLKDENTEVIEVEAQETSAVVNKPLHEVKLPQGSLVAAVVHDGEVEIATGDTVVRPGNQLVIFVTRQVLKKVEKLLTVRLEYF